MPSIRLRRPGAPQQPPSSDALPAPSSSDLSDAPPLAAAPAPGRRTSGRPSAAATNARIATTSRNPFQDDVEMQDANTSDPEEGGAASSALTSIDTPHAELGASTAGDEPLASPIDPAPVKRGPGRPRGSGRGRGRGRGQGRGGGPSREVAQDSADSFGETDAPQASKSLKVSIRPRRSTAAPPEDDDNEDDAKEDDAQDAAGPSRSQMDADQALGEQSTMSSPAAPRRGGTRGRGRPRGRGRGGTHVASSLSSRTDLATSPPPRAPTRGRKSNIPSAQHSGEEDDDDDEGPVAPAASRASRGKRKRGGGDDGSLNATANNSDDGDGEGDEDEDDEDDEDDDDGDEEDEEAANTSTAAKSAAFDKRSMPPFKKRPSRTRGYRLSFENHQTVLIRLDDEELAESLAKKAKKKSGRGRKARGGLPRTRIIEDSEDENTDDDRPRPPAPAEPDDVDVDKIMPLNERFKVKVMGEPYTMNSDELELADDVDGEKKIDRLGNLLGDREWKAPSFTSSLRGDPEKVYFLSVDAARAVGFRDSLTLFRTDLRLIKLSLCQQEKDDLIAAGRLKEQLRGRNVTAVAARNVFKIHGAKTIKNGRAVIDDYYESDARTRLENSGRLHSAGQMLPEDDVRSAAEIRRQTDKERDRSRRPPDAISIATSDAQGQVVLTHFGDNGASPFVRSTNHTSRRMQQQRADLTEENWMYEMALSVRGMNAELEQYRKDRLLQFRAAGEVYKSDVAAVAAVQAEAAAAAAPRGVASPLNAVTNGSGDSGGNGGGGDVKMEIDGDGGDGETAAKPATPAQGEEPRAPSMDVDADADAASEGTSGDAATTAQRTAARTAQATLTNHAAPPVGLYEPTTNLPHYLQSSQPTTATLQKLSDRPRIGGEQGEDRAKKAVLGGTKIGGGAWGVMSWHTALALRGGVEGDERDAEEGKRGKLIAGTGGE